MASEVMQHIIKEIRISPVETYFGAPGSGRIVGPNAKGVNYGCNQREWLVQVTTNSGITGVTNARPAMNRGSLTDLYAKLKLLLGRDVFEFYRVSRGRVAAVNPRWEELLRENGFIDFVIFRS